MMDKARSGDDVALAQRDLRDEILRPETRQSEARSVDRIIMLREEICRAGRAVFSIRLWGLFTVAMLLGTRLIPWPQTTPHILAVLIGWSYGVANVFGAV